MNNTRVIRVTGKGIIQIKPDTTKLTITLQGNSKEYAEAVKRSTEETDSLKDTLASLGFSKSDIKTLAFEVEPKYESYRDRTNNYKEKFVGYQFSHILKIEFLNDRELLGKTLYALAHASSHPEFRISYTVKDPEAKKNEMLKKAVEDAKTKGKVLADASGVSLGEIVNIDYSWGQINFEVAPMTKLSALGESSEINDSYMMEIEPDDIEASDTVTIVWEIK